MALNSISTTKTFSMLEKMTNFSKSFSKYNVMNYMVPKDLYKGRIDVFKGYKLPFVKEVYDATVNDIIIPVILTESANQKEILPDLHNICKVPRSMINFDSEISKERVTFCDISMAAKYQRERDGSITYLNIQDLTLFHMLTTAYVQNKLNSDISLSEISKFFILISETYSLILTKIIDNMFPVASASSTSHDKLFFLCSCFCLQYMFGIEKSRAVDFAFKTRFVVDKRGVQNECAYIESEKNFMEGCDYKTRFPIDVFCEVVASEYSYMIREKFTAEHLLMMYTRRLGRMAQFSLESVHAFITMLILGKANMAMYNDMIIKKYLEIGHDNFTKELAAVITHV